MEEELEREERDAEGRRSGITWNWPRGSSLGRESDEREEAGHGEVDYL